MCFPLSLTAFESYLLADDRPHDAPMCFYLRLSLAGRVDRQRWERAVRRVVARQPLLRSTVAESDGQWLWVPTSQWPETLWQPGRDPDRAPQFPPLDIRREPGLRVSVSVRGQRSVVWLQFHHVAVDGIAAAKIAEELLVAYAADGTESATAAALESLDPHRLHDRANQGGPFWRRCLAAASGMLAAVGIWQYLTHRVQALVARPNDETPSTTTGTSPALAVHRFEPRQVRELRWMARRQGQTVNDLLITQLLQSLEAWNAEHAGDARLGHIRLAVPVNQRGDDQAGMPACNQVAMIFVDRSSRAIRRTASLARSVALDMWFVKRFGLSRVFLWGLSLLQALPGGMSRTLGSAGSLATAVLSNLGVTLDDCPLPRRHGLLAAGNLTLEAFEFLPPVRPQTALACGVATYAGRLSLAMHYDGRVLSAEAAGELLDDLVARVSRFAVGRCGAVPPKSSREPIGEPVALAQTTSDEAPSGIAQHELEPVAA